MRPVDDFPRLEGSAVEFISMLLILFGWLTGRASVLKKNRHLSLKVLCKSRRIKARVTANPDTTGKQPLKMEIEVMEA